MNLKNKKNHRYGISFDICRLYVEEEEEEENMDLVVGRKNLDLLVWWHQSRVDQCVILCYITIGWLVDVSSNRNYIVRWSTYITNSVPGHLWSHDCSHLWTCLTVQHRVTILEPGPKIWSCLVTFCLGESKIIQCLPTNKKWIESVTLLYLIIGSLQ